MKKIIPIIVLLILYVSNFWGKEKINTYSQDSSISCGSDSNGVVKMQLGPNEVVNETFLRQWIRHKYIKLNKSISVTKLEGYNDIVIYEAKLNGEIPNSLKERYTFVHFVSHKYLFLVPFEFNCLYRFDQKLMFGGYYSNREFDYYNIYELQDGQLVLRLDTGTTDRNAVIVGYYKTDECVEYQPLRLKFQYFSSSKKINFKGRILNFCKPRIDRDPERKTPYTTDSISIEYIYNGQFWTYSKNSHYTFW